MAIVFPSRTFAIIKPHALHERLAIESRILDSGFEIVKERQLQFHPEDENLFRIFGDEAETLKGGPVWVYVLDRVNAVQEWNAVMGDDDPEVARSDAPNSLRALYGETIDRNAVFGASTEEIAEHQISTLFVSSPLFPPSHSYHEEDLDVPPLPLSATGSNRSLASDSEDESRPVPRERYMSEESQLSTPSTGERRRGRPSETQFRARPVPASNSSPSIQPRSSRAALLRAGVAVPPLTNGPRPPPSKEALAKTFANVPGHKRAGSIAVASTAPPTIVPRATRASALRTGEPTEAPPPRRRASTTSINDTPGYKRQLNIQVASTAPPAIQPRPTRTSVLRTGQTPPKKPSRPSTSDGSQSSTFEGVPGHKRRESIQVASVKPPTTVPRLNRSAALRAQGGNVAPPSSWKLPAAEEPRPNASTLARRSSTSSLSSRPAVTRGRTGASDSVDEGDHHVARAPSVGPPRPPSITPRTNRSALLRALIRPGQAKTASLKFVTV